MSQGVVQELPGMPAPSALRRLESEGQCVVTFADRVLFCYDADDIGMRNMAVVAVTDAGVVHMPSDHRPITYTLTTP